MAASVYDDTQLTCSSILKEIAYTVNVSEVIPDGTSNVSSEAYLKVDSITALVVLADEPVSGVKDAQGKVMASVQQRFSIKFVKKGSTENN